MVAKTGGCNRPTFSAHASPKTLSLGRRAWHVTTQRHPGSGASAVAPGPVGRWESDMFLSSKGCGVRRGCSRLQPRASREAPTQLGQLSKHRSQGLLEMTSLSITGWQAGRQAAVPVTPVTPSACSLSQSVTPICSTSAVLGLTAPVPPAPLTWTEDGVGSTLPREVALTRFLGSRREGQGSAHIPATRFRDTLLLCGPSSFPPRGHSSKIFAYKFLTTKTWLENALYPGINGNL